MLALSWRTEVLPVSSTVICCCGTISISARQFRKIFAVLIQLVAILRLSRLFLQIMAGCARLFSNPDDGDSSSFASVVFAGRGDVAAAAAISRHSVIWCCFSLISSGILFLG